MKIAQVKIFPWDRPLEFELKEDLKKGDWVLVETEFGMEIGWIDGITEKSEREISELKKIIRKAKEDEINGFTREEKETALKKCRELIRKHNLEMKLVDVRCSYDGSKITFAFVADGRVDFRDLVRDLASVFNKTVRLQQIGIRDEAKISGEYGPCGRPLCCRKLLKDLTSITSEMAEVQQITHRGSERLSGMCGRLMCCLGYEYNGYCALAEKMPPIGTRVNIDGKKGAVVGHHVLKQTVDVEFFENGEGNGGGMIVEIDLNRDKKN